MRKYTMKEQLVLRGISDKKAYKIIDNYMIALFKKLKVNPLEKFYWECYYMFDGMYRGDFENILEFQKYLHRNYKNYLNHFETNNITSFISDFIEGTCTMSNNLSYEKDIKIKAEDLKKENV